MKTKKSMSLLLVLAILLQILSPFSSIDAKAEFVDEIFTNIEILGLQNQYNPGDELNIKVDFEIPDDSPGKVYKGGDSFILDIPQGLIPSFDEKKIQNKATLKYDKAQNKLILTLEDSMNQLMNRRGGFNIKYRISEDIDTNKEYKVYNQTISIGDGHSSGNNTNQEVDETLNKGKQVYPNYNENPENDEIVWYIRVNRSNNLNNGDTVTLEDVLINDHEIVPGSIHVTLEYMDPAYSNNPSAQSISNRRDYKTYQLEELGDRFKISGLEIEHKKIGNIDAYPFYTIEYKTKYNGDYSSTDGSVYLENIVTMKTQNYTQNADAIETLYFDGWAEGDENLTSVEVEKKWENTSENEKEDVEIILLADGKEVRKGIIYKDGSNLLEFKNLPKKNLNGEDIEYTIKEESIDGFEIPEIKKELPNDGIIKFFVTNTKSSKIYKDLSLVKKWRDSKDNDINNEFEDYNLEINLIGKRVDGSKVYDKTFTLNKDNDWSILVKNLLVEDGDGKITYNIEEKNSPQGFETDISEKENGFLIVNKERQEDIEVNPLKLIIKKIDSFTKELLKGAKFELEFIPYEEKIETENDRIIREYHEAVVEEHEDWINVEKEYEDIVSDYWDEFFKDEVEIDDKNTEPKDSVEEPKDSVEEPKDSVEEPKDSVEEPKDSVEEPKDSVEEPKDFVEEPKDSVEEPKDSVEEPRDFVEEPKDSVEEPKDSVEESKDSVEEPKNIDNKEFKNQISLLAMSDFEIGSFLISNEDYKIDNEISNKRTLITDENGRIVINDLKEGDYILREIKAPEGYEISNIEYKFSVREKDGKLIIKTLEFSKDVELDKDKNIIIVSNDPKPEEPEPIDPKPEEPKPEEPKPEEPKPEEPKPEEPKPEEPKPEEPKPEEPKPEEPKPEEPKPEDPKPEEPKPTKPSKPNRRPDRDTKEKDRNPKPKPEEPKEEKPEEVVELEKEEVPLARPEVEKPEEKVEEEIVVEEEVEIEKEEVPLARPEVEKPEKEVMTTTKDEAGPINVLPKTGESRLLYNIAGLVLLVLGLFVRRKENK